MSNWELLYQYDPDHPLTAGLIILRPTDNKVHAHVSKPHTKHRAARTNLDIRSLGFALIMLGIGGMVGPFISELRMEASYLMAQASRSVYALTVPKTDKPLPAAVPVIVSPLMTPDGASIEPINREFSIIVPKVGINAAVAANVDPANADEYLEKLKTGVAHAKTSFTPDQDGTTYLFSHSTNFDWFVKDVNAVFYLLKNLEKGDNIIVFYEGKQYTYTLRSKRVVSPDNTQYLVPVRGKKQLILQTCWPPGSTTERLLIFADLVEEEQSI